MLVQTIHTTTTNLGHLVLDVPTEYMSKNIEVVLVINEIKTEISPNKYESSDLIGKFEWQI